ncbi:MAG TPA: nucleoside phosphorylase [Anaerolineaceae bacterium]
MARFSPDEVQHHINLKKGDVGRYVLLPGDPGRCQLIAQYFDNPQFITQKREYVTYTGTLLGEKVSVTSTGIGCPSTAIAVEELIAIGADTFIRVGTSGGMQPQINTGDVGIITGAIRDEGTTSHYLPIEFPAVANVDVVMALREGAKRAGVPAHEGVSQSKDSFYGEVEPGRMPVSDQLFQRWKAWVEGGAVCSEMEAAAIFIISSIHRKRASGVMLMVGDDMNPETNPPEVAAAAAALLDIHRPVRVAIEALKVLIERDRAGA